MAPEHYRAPFFNISSKWGYTFLNDKKIVPTELRKKLLDTIHFGQAGTTYVTAEARNLLEAEYQQRQSKQACHRVRI